jgi:cell division protein FtsB
MSDSELQRDIGSLSAQVTTLNREIRELKDDVRTLRDDFAQVKGGARTLIGLSALLGGGISWALTHVFGGR